MARMIQVRHVPDRVHRRLKARAAAAGMTLTDYLRLELERIAETLSPAEVAERLAAVEPVDVGESAAVSVRAEREGR